MWSKARKKEEESMKKIGASRESIPGPISWHIFENCRKNKIFMKKSIFQNPKSISEQARVRGFSTSQRPHHVSPSIRGNFRNRNVQTDTKAA